MNNHYKSVRASVTRWLMSLAVLTVLWTTNANAALTVNVTYSGSAALSTGALAGPYSDLATAITDLNGSTFTGTGDVTLTCSGGPETAPAAGYVIQTVSGAAGLNIVIDGGSQTVTAAAGLTAGNTNDAVFKIVGSDYITIKNFTINENANAAITVASNTMTEFGIAVYAASTTNGAQNNTISGNTINLGTSGYTQAFGILSTCTFTSAGTAGGTAPTSQTPVAGGENSNLKIYSNIISNVRFGIAVVSAANTATFSQQGLDIGGTSALTGNTITYTTGAAITTSYNNMSLTVHGGIIVRNPAAINIRFNNITGTVTGAAVNTNGITMVAGTSPAGFAYTNTVSDNTVLITAPNASTGASAITGIDLGYGLNTSLAVSATLAASSNVITINQNSNVAVSGAIIGLKANYACISGTFNSNNITVNQSHNVAASSTNSSTVTAMTVGGGTTSTPTVNVLNNTILINRTNTAAATFTATMSGAQIGIQAVTATTNMNIGSAGNPNSITIKEGIAGAGTNTYTSAVSLISCNAAHGAINIINNTFNTTASTIRSTGALDIVLGGASTLTGLLTIKSNTVNVDRVAASGAVGFYTQTSTSPNDPADTISNNNITITGLSGTSSATIINRLGGSSSAVRNICNNTISVSGTNTGTCIGISNGWSNPTRIAGNSITFSTASPTLTGVTLNANGTTPTVLNNTLSLSSTATSPTAMTGIVSATGPNLIAYNSFTNMNFSGIITASPTVSGIAVSSGTGNIIRNNTINNISVGAATSTGNPVIDGILISGGTSTDVYQNKIYGITTGSTGTTVTVNGIRISGGTTNQVYNNLIGLGLTTAPASANPDGVRGISITSTTSSSTQRIYFNTVYVYAQSTGANFGTSGIFHSTSATATTSALDMRNNIIANTSILSGTGRVVAFRRSAGTAGTLANYASTSNRNMLYSTDLVYSDGTSTAATFAAYQGGVFTAGTVAPRDANSFSETVSNTAGVFFQDFTGSSSNFLHMVAGLTTRIESGALPITTPAITVDYDNATRNATTPDVGADEFIGISPAPAITLNSVTPPATSQCATVARLVSVNVTTPSGLITSVSLQGNNGAAFGPIAMTNTAGSTWEASIPASSPVNATVTWTVIATSDIPLSTTYIGATYSDEALFGISGGISASVNPVVNGNSTVLTASLSSATPPSYAATPVVTNATTDEDFGNVTIGGVLNNSTAVNSFTGTIGTATGTLGSYSNFTAFGPYAITAGTTYSISLSSVQQGGGFTNIMAAWIDYNRNGVFSDPGEQIFVTSAAAGDFTGSGSFTVPTTANNGLARMRVLCYEGSSITGPTQAVSYGEYEEYMMNISSTNSGGGANIPAISSVTWSNGSTTNPTTVSPTTTTSYTATIVSNGCTLSPSPSKSITVIDPPAITLNSITPSTTQCTASSRLISVNVTTNVGTITGVNITYNNGAAVGPVAMTNTSGTTWQYTIPAASPTNTNVTWSITADNSVPLSTTYTGTPYQDDPLLSLPVTATATPSTVANGGSVVLAASLPSSITLGTNNAGTAISTTGTPYRTGTSTGTSHRTQFIVLASELASAGVPAGNINSLGFTVTNVPTGFMSNLVFSIGNTAATSIGTTYLTDAVSQVYTVPTWTPVTGLNNHVFQTPFNWDGSSNILINICGDLTVAGSGSGTTLATFTTAAQATLANNTVCAATTGSNPTGNVRPVMTFGVDGFAPYTVKWNDGVSDFSTATSTTVTPSVSTPYTFTITKTSNGCSKVINTPVTVIFPPVVTLNSVTPPATTQCAATARLVSVNITTPTGTVTGATLQGNNGAAFGPITMTNTSGTTWEGTIPAASPTNSNVTWSVIASNSVPLSTTYTGASFSDDPLFGASASISASANPVCLGTPSDLTAKLTKAGGTATIGTGITLTSATTQPTAFCNRWPSYRMQTVYTAAELSAAGLAAGNITAMAFNINSLGDGATNNSYRVKIGHTGLSTLSGAFVDTTTGFTTVFPSQTYTHTASGLQTINFSTPFNWDGTSNIIVQVVHNGADITNNSITYYTATVGNTVAYTTTAATNTASFSNQRLNVVFTGNAGYPIASVLWSNGSTTNPTTVNPSGTTAYTVDIVSSGCTFSPSPSLTLNVSTPPNTPTANNVTGCSGLPTASVSPVGGTAPHTYKWYAAASGGTALQTSTSTTFSSAITATTTWYVSEVNTTTLCESGRVAVTQTVHSLSITSGVASFCSSGGSQSTSLTAVSSNPGFTYTWAATTGSVTPSTGTTVTANLTTSSDFTVTAVDGGCTMTASKSLGVYDFPTANISSNGPICEGGTINLNSGFVAGSFVASCITPPVGLSVAPPSAVTLTSGGTAAVTLSGGSLDDGYWNALPIGFTFNYFGSSYTTINVGTNGNVNFGASGTTQYNFTGGFPNAANPANTIAVCARDLQLSATGGSFGFGTGTVKYWTEGVAPNRKFIAQYSGCTTWYSTNASDGTSNAEVVLYETTGSVDIRVISATNPAATTGSFINDTRNKYIGLQDGTKTVGATSPNCSTSAPNYWNGVADQITSPQAWRFDPANHYDITWTGTNLTSTTGTDLFTTSTTAMTAGSYVYTFVGTDQTTGCTNALNPASITVSVRPIPVDPISSDKNICGAGSATFTVSNAGSMGAADTIRWYSQASGGSVIGRGATYTTPTVPSTTSYWVESYNGACINPAGRVQVTLNVGTPPGISPTGPVSEVCPGAPITIDVTSSNPGYTYVWTPGSLAGATQNINAPAATTTYTVTATDNTNGAFQGCITSATLLVNVHNTPQVSAGADQLKNVGGTATLTATYTALTSCVKISEVIFFGGGGTGDQSSWPAYLVAHDDDVELTNTGTSSADISGAQLIVESSSGSTLASWTFPSGTIVPSGGIVVCHSGSGTNDLANLYFNDPATFGWSSGTVLGVYLKSGSTIIDAVGFNGHSFSVGSTVTAGDFTGTTVTSASGFAGAYLNGADVNSGTNWVQGAPTTNGSLNPGLLVNCNSNPFTVTWTGGNLVGPSVGDVVTTPVFIAPPQTWTYSVSLTDGVCTTTDNVDVTTQFPTAPTANFSVNNVNQTTGGNTSTAIFTDLSLNVPDNWLWSITGPGAVTYVNGTSATSQNPQVQFGGSGLYTVALTVDNAAGSDTKTNTDYITVTPAYCIPTYATGTGSGDFISKVIVAGTTLNNTTTGAPSPYYTLFPASGSTTGTMAIGYAQTMTVSGGTFSTAYIRGWIDYNQNGLFEASETIGVSPNVGASATGTIAFTVDPSALAGNTRMRLRSSDTGPGPAVGDVCGATNSAYGETEDYVVTLIAITSAPNCASPITVSASCITQSTLSWPAATGYPLGYYVTVYDDAVIPNYLDFQTDAGNVLSYNLAILQPATVYHYVIEPYNAIGTATGCTIGTFTSGASQAVTPSVALAAPPTPAVNYNLGAEGVTVPALPCGVTVENADQLGTSAWYTSTIAPRTGTKHMRIDKNSDNVTPLDDYFYTVPINVSAGKVYRITWWDRASSASFTESYEVRMATLPDASTMLGSTPDLFTTNSTTYAQKQGTDYLVPVGGSGVVYFGFRATSPANRGSIYIDDIVVSEVPVPQINPAYCTTIPSMYDQIFVTPIPGATNYRFKIVGTGGQAGYNFEHYRNNSNPDYRLKWAPGVIYGYQYNVQVASFKSGVWSPYGPACPVTLGAFPAIKLRNNPATVAGPCDYVISDLNDRLLTDSLSGANDYMYKIVEDVPGGAYDYDFTWQRYSGNLDFRLVWAYQSSPLIDRVRFGYSYDVQTRALVGKTGATYGNRPGEWGPYGATCKLDLTATSPTTSLTNCAISLASLNDQIFTTPVTGATNYEYEFTAPGYTAVVYRGSGNNDYRLIWIPTTPSVPGGARYATTYTVRVKAYVGGVWLNYGAPCTVTTPAAPTTSISTVGFCGSTLSPGQFSSTINCTAIPGASMYSFRITNVGGVAYSKVIYNYNANTSFSLSRTLVCCGQQNLLPNATYTIEVAYYAGVWSAYGPACTFTTGATVPRYSPFASEGVEAAEGALNLSVYPNPATINEQYSLELQGITAANEKVQVAIYNMIGDRVYRADVITKEEATLTIKPEMQLAAGVYMAEAQLNGNVYRVKFVVK